MKIQQSQASPDLFKKDMQKGSIQKGFQSAMNEASKELKGVALERLLTQIDEQGKVLTKERTLQNVTAYKRLVKQFLEEAVHHGLTLSEKNSTDRYGRHRTFKLVETIENKLVELQEEILDKEKDGVNLLSLIGEIKGMLVDLSL